MAPRNPIYLSSILKFNPDVLIKSDDKNKSDIETGIKSRQKLIGMEFSRAVTSFW